MINFACHLFLPNAFKLKHTLFRQSNVQKLSAQHKLKQILSSETLRMQRSFTLVHHRARAHVLLGFYSWRN